ncbi:unnamed protein product [Polarella glacialis]|uniref:Uncharacterized protein n=1 Tax=Polarella glacialis TaxID=89957 RepID=A0A813FCQ5_POLGL|nr:unnamed protein product [Polarella glacialis]
MSAASFRAMEENNHTLGFQATASEGGNMRERSANLFSDPKMMELQHYAKSHKHENRLREAADLEERVRQAQGIKTRLPPPDMSEAALRTDGCENVNKILTKIGSYALIPECKMGQTLPAGFSFAESQADPKFPDRVTSMRMDTFQTRLQWRDKMDDCLRRLMQDMDLARDKRLKEYSNQARCDHLDRIYEWYETHGKKEARKERAAPPYVRYSHDGPVMPGSMRVPRKNLLSDKTDKKKESHGMSQSQSSPTLMAAGAMNMETTPTPS